MTLADRWLLPDGIEEVLPPRAQQIEHLRRHLLDKMDTWGYELVMPPALEHLDALLTGTGKDLDLRTFKVTDQLSGRMLGLSADTTPQVTRIDAHSLAPEGIGRFCYCRTVFHTRARSLLASRTPTQIGAELFGTGGAAADVELISLMIQTLEASRLSEVHLDLGNVALYRGLVELAELDESQQQTLTELLRLKCRTDIKQWAGRNIANPTLQSALALLAGLQGKPEALTQTLTTLGQLVPELAEEINHLTAVAAQIAERYPQLPVTLDLTELRGYQYHTGLVFAAYVPGYGDAVATGGRYDHTGNAFGRGRAARGFSADLRVLAQLGDFTATTKIEVHAPFNEAPGQSGLWQAVEALRAEGYRVIQGDPSDSSRVRLEWRDGQWQLSEQQQN